MTTMLDYAVYYVEKFHAVVPCGAWSFENENGDEINMWKTPLIKRWSTAPLSTAKEVRKEFRKWERWNKTPGIGIATGQICGGYIVIDLDRRPDKGVDGYDFLLDWQIETKMYLPETWTVLTGSGSYHLYYKTDKAMRGYVNDSIGVDLRADGNYVVVPPSFHKSGKRYEWEISPGDCECAEADDTVLAFIDHCRPQGSEFGHNSTRRGEGGEWKMLLTPELPEGNRHTPLISAIGTMNRLGFSDEAIKEAIRIENDTKCCPPLTERELQREIFPAIYRWEKGVPAEEWKSREQYQREQKERQLRDLRYKRALADFKS